MADSTEKQTNDGVPHCQQCQHYFITWDKTFPYGCRAIQFKSYRQPEFDVLESSGQNCLLYQAKQVAIRKP